MKNSEIGIIDAFKDLIDPVVWGRISGVFWIRALDNVCYKNHKFREWVYAGDFSKNEFSYMFELYFVTDICCDIREAPLFQLLGYDNGTIHVLTELFLWSILTQSGEMFGYGFGGIDKMNSCRLSKV